MEYPRVVALIYINPWCSVGGGGWHVEAEDNSLFGSTHSTNEEQKMSLYAELEPQPTESIFILYFYSLLSLVPPVCRALT